MSEVGDVWYRIENKQYANYDPFEEYEQTGSHTVIELYKFRVEKVTPHGVRLNNGKFINHDWTKQFANPSMEEAEISFVARKKRQGDIYRAKAARADRAIDLLKNGNGLYGKFYMTHDYSLDKYAFKMIT